MTTFTLVDDNDRRLISNVRPEAWRSPTPATRYNLVAIGAGTAGLISAIGTAGLGGKAALVERSLMGGDCLVVGCVPSKTLLRAAKAAADARKAERYGVNVSGVEVDFAAVMARVRAVRADISPVDSAARYSGAGVDVFFGAARFTGPDTLQAGDQVLRFKKAVIATGTRPVAPPIPGLTEAGYLTNETLFSLTERPARLAVIGGGPIGCELAQALQRLGVSVTVFEMTDHVLPLEDVDAAEIVQNALIADGVSLVLNARIERIEVQGDEKVVVHAGGRLSVDAILVAAGRAPNVEGLGLETVGVEATKNGITVDDFMRTTNPNIFAAGDVALRARFTHTADFSARLVIQNALFLGNRRWSNLVVPWATYTEPEVAHVGLYEREAEARGLKVQTITVPLAENDRAHADGVSEGFVRVHVRAGSDKILGATVVGPHAGDLIGELSLAITNKIGLLGVAATIHPYPTLAEAIRRAADAYNRTRLTPWFKSLATRWLAWQRR